MTMQVKHIFGELKIKSAVKQHPPRLLFYNMEDWSWDQSPCQLELTEIKCKQIISLYIHNDFNVFWQYNHNSQMYKESKPIYLQRST